MCDFLNLFNKLTNMHDKNGFFISPTDALSTSKVADLMCLHKLNSRKWHIQAACATTGEGIFEAMNELSSLVKEFKKEIR